MKKRTWKAWAASVSIAILLAACDRGEVELAPPRPDIQAVGFGPGGVILDFQATYVGGEAGKTCHPGLDDQTQHPMARTATRVTTDNRDLWFSAERLEKPVI